MREEIGTNMTRQTARNFVGTPTEKLAKVINQAEAMIHGETAPLWDHTRVEVQLNCLKAAQQVITANEEYRCST